MSHPSYVEIDFIQFKKNITNIKKYLQEVSLCLPVKANAYGHGLVPIGKAAVEAGVDYLAVAHLQEGVLLRKAKIEIPILVLGAFHEDQIEDFRKFNLEFSISSEFKANLVAAKWGKRRNKKYRVHLEVDTGMQRTGVRPSTAASLFTHLKNLQCFEICGIYSHLATADSPLDGFAIYQIEQFRHLLEDPIFAKERMIRHLANSGGTAYFPSSHFDMVRPSLLAFGYLSKDRPEGLKEVAPCFSLKSKVSYFKVVEAGQGISYGHTYITKKRTRVVTVPIGYGDGYRRCLSNRGSVLIRGHRFPIVGMVCMDQFMVDVGDMEVRVGDEVVLIGRQGGNEILLQEIADLCDTTPYEILCGFNERLPRVEGKKKELTP